MVSLRWSRFCTNLSTSYSMDGKMNGLIDYRDKHLDDVCELADQIAKLCKEKEFGLSISALGSAFGYVVEEAILQSVKTAPKDIKGDIWSDALGLICDDFGSIARRNSIDLTFTKEHGEESK